MLETTLATLAQLLATHGYLIVFFWTFADQAALPLPGAPLLIAAGAVAATGQLDIAYVILTATGATLLADLLWYTLGRQGGGPAISMVCKLSLEPESCVTTTRNAFGRFGPVTLIIAKYLPGVQTLAPASAGFVGAPLAGFLLLDALGTLLFVVPFCLGGYYFQAELSQGLAALAEVSGGLALALGALCAAYLIVKATQWIRFYRGHRLRRLSAEDLHAKRMAGVPVTVVDLRQRLDYALQPQLIPGALRIPITDVYRRRGEIPTAHEIALVCT